MHKNGLYDREYECPCCGDKFKSKKVLSSRIVVVRKDSDFCPYYSGLNPLFYEARVCPYCSFAFTDGFGLLRESQRAKWKQAQKRETDMNLWGERDLDTAKDAFKRALETAGVIGEKHLILAGMSMRMAWLHRYAEENREERRFLAQALYHYELTYEEEPFEKMGMDRDTIHYLLGELNGVMGRYTEAKRWFGKVITLHTVKRALHNLAEDQWEKYKAEMERLSEYDKTLSQNGKNLAHRQKQIQERADQEKSQLDQRLSEALVQLENELHQERRRLFEEMQKAFEEKQKAFSEKMDAMIQLVQKEKEDIQTKANQAQAGLEQEIKENYQNQQMSAKEQQAEAILLETEQAKKKIDEDALKEMIRLETLAVERVKLMVESGKARLDLDLDAQNRLANLDQQWRNGL
jgi:uncharacterized protein (DUF2225 family)